MVSKKSLKCIVGEQMENCFKNKKILITGGAGSLGKAMVKRLLEYQPQVIRILDNNETELFELEQELGPQENIRFLIGDVRDEDRIKRAMEDIEIVIHAAALKHVMSSEYNPFETVKTNVIGTKNIISAALANRVDKVIFTSSDKAANPNNTMGATKLLGERLITSANYSRKGKKRTIFASVRFGNIIGTRGSVIPLFKKQILNSNPLTLTNPDMTRFMMSIEHAVNLVFKCVEMAKGGEIFILKMPVIKMGDLIKVIREMTKKKNPVEIIGAKTGETMYEELMTEEEAKKVIELKDMYVLLPLITKGFRTQNKKFFEQLAKNYPDPIKDKVIKYISKDIVPFSKDQIKELLYESGAFK